MTPLTEDDSVNGTENVILSFKEACKTGEVEEVKDILTKATGDDLVNLLQPNPGEGSPLSQAISNGHQQIVREILQRASQLSKLMLVAFDYNGQTAFSSACESDNLEVVKLFLFHAADNQVFMEQLLEPSGGSTGNTPLHYAALSSNENIIIEILKHLDDFQVRIKLLATNRKSESVLHCICSKGHAQTIGYLLSRLDVSFLIDKIVSMRDYLGNTPFHQACVAERDDPGLIQMLLQVIPYETLEPVLFEQNSQNGRTVFHSAIAASNSSITHELFSALPNIGLVNVACQTSDSEQNNVFHLACLKGDERTYRISEKLNANFMVKVLVAKNSAGQNALHCACVGGMQKAAEDIIERTAKHKPPYELLLEADLEGNYSLHHASGGCFSSFCTFILNTLGGEKRARILVAENKDGLNPLGCAFMAKKDGNKLPDPLRAETISSILKHVPDSLLESQLKPNSVAKENMFFAAASKGDTEIVKVILDRIKHLPDFRSKVLHSYNNIRNTPLIKACMNGHLETVKAMLECLDHKTMHGMLLATNNERRNVVHFASAYGDTEALGTIMDWATSESEADQTVNALILAKDIHLNTPFHYACMKGRLDVLKTLLKYIENNPVVLHQVGLSAAEQGDTPLHIACSYASVTTTKLLMEALSKLSMEKFEEVITASDTKKMTALHHASLKGHEELVLIILQHLNAKSLKNLLQKENENGETALHLCCLSGHLNVLRTITGILQSSSELASTDIFNKKDVNGKTLLHVGCSIGNREMVQELIKVRKIYTSFSRKNILCATDNLGRTCLHDGCEAGDSHIVRMLLYEAYINNCMEELLCIKDDLNMSAFLVALESGEFAAVKEILYNAKSTGNLDKLLALQYGEEKGTFLHRACKYQHINAKSLNAIVDADPLVMVKLWDKKDANNKTFIQYLSVAKRELCEVLVSLLGEKLKDDPEGSWDDDDSSSSSSSSSSQSVEKLKTHIVLTHSFLEKISEGKCLNLMKHKKVENYLLRMWGAHGRLVFYGNFTIYLMLTIMLTLYVTGHTYTVEGQPDNPVVRIFDSTLSRVTKYFVMVLAGVTMVIEFLQCFARKVDYFKSFGNIVDFCVCLGSLFITAFNEADEYKVWLHEMGIALVLIAIFNAIWMTTKIPSFESRLRRTMALTFIMLFRVTRRVLTFVPAVTIVSLAFAVTFYNLFQLNDAFQHIGYSFMKTIVMATGEYEYEGIFLPEDIQNEPPFFVLSCIIFVVFIIVMTISVMSLLVAAAVGEISLLMNKSEMMAFDNLMELTHESEQVKNLFFCRRKKK